MIVVLFGVVGVFVEFCGVVVVGGWGLVLFFDVENVDVVGWDVGVVGGLLVVELYIFLVGMLRGGVGVVVVDIYCGVVVDGCVVGCGYVDVFGN